MKQSISFNIYIMSYSRPDVMMTEKLVEYSTLVVREDEADEYRKYGDANLLVIPKGEAHDFASTFFGIVNNTPEDVICILDDDIKSFCYRQDVYLPLKGDSGIEITTSEIERIGQLLYDLNLGLAFSCMTGALFAYDREFAFKGMPGPVRWVNKNAFKAKYNPNDAAAGDIDIALQELLMNRVVLQEKFLFAANHQNEIIGKNEVLERSDHVNYVHAMKNKWGKYYSYDFKKNEARIKVSR